MANFGTSNSKDKYAKILVGPVVGKVTHNSARILLELDQTVDGAKCILVNLAEKDKIFQEIHVNFKKGRPSICKLNNLKENSKYIFFVDLESQSNSSENTNNDNIYESKKHLPKAYIRTFLKKPKYFDIICVYGNNTKDIVASIPSKFTQFISRGYYNAGEFTWDTKENLWINILEVRCKQIDCIVHLGKQVDLIKTMEVLVKNNKEMIKIRNMSSIQQRKYIEEIFREQYRYNWNKKYFKDVLSNVQNLMMYGSEDIIYTNTSNIDTWRREGIKINVVQSAYKIYDEYQKQLYEDVSDYQDDNKNNDKKIGTSGYYHHHIWGNFGIFFMDMKGNKLTKFVKDKNKSSIGKSQYNSIKTFLNILDLKICFIVSEYSLVNNLFNDGSKNKIKNNRYDKTISIDNLPSTNKEYWNIFQQIEKFKESVKIFMVAGNYGDNNPNKIKITNTETGKDITQISVGNITGPSSKKFNFQKNIIYKIWSISIDYCNNNNYGYIVNTLKDNKITTSIKVITYNQLSENHKTILPDKKIAILPKIKPKKFEVSDLLNDIDQKYELGKNVDEATYKKKDELETNMSESQSTYKIISDKNNEKTSSSSTNSSKNITNTNKYKDSYNSTNTNKYKDSYNSTNTNKYKDSYNSTNISKYNESNKSNSDNSNTTQSMSKSNSIAPKIDKKYNSDNVFSKFESPIEYLIPPLIYLDQEYYNNYVDGNTRKNINNKSTKLDSELYFF